ncbi:MAG: DEAD/DEAH box helicase, partial [Clostridia bacterium]|nr:DEAD/DEAH box helicase [Clostridia bacterium]
MEILSLDALSGGFELDGKFIVVTKADRVFTKRKAHSRRSGSGIHGQRISDFDDLEPGELVVHLDYGVGRYIGSSEILVDGHRNEVYTIEYADGGKLHVPCSHAHLLSRYVGVKGESAPLHRLDGKRWDKDRKDAQKAVCDLAAALLETQAKRETAPGFKYDINCDGREAFDAAFPYEETPDQLKAIADIKRDMEVGKIMDRLLVGDVGFGKTEVAFRAMFKTILDAKQAVLIAPTTILARQHYENLKPRLKEFGIDIALLTRLQTSAENQDTLKRLADGTLHLVVSTHKVLSDKVQFHDLGLLVLDEEQRFGVNHKEKLKEKYPKMNVLTLSATPIPRTLNMALTGIRDISVLETAPVGRLPVQTYVTAYSDTLVKDAIVRECARQGQTLILLNNIDGLDVYASKLRRMLGDIRIVTAHGQMQPTELDKRMS